MCEITELELYCNKVKPKNGKEKGRNTKRIVKVWDSNEKFLVFKILFNLTKLANELNSSLRIK